MIVALAKAIPVKWLMVAPEKDLLHNLADRWEKRTGQKAGRIGDSMWEEADRVNVATFQTLSKAMENNDPRFHALVNDVGGFIVDEVHQAPSDSYFKVCMAIPNAYWRLGFSGTPLSRGDSKSPFAIGATGEVICKLSPQFLIERGFISRPEITMVRVPQGAPSAKTYQGAYKERIVRSRVRNNVILECVAQAQKPCLIFVQYTNHGKELKELLSKKHPELRVQYIHGTHSTKQRDQVIDSLKWGDVDVLIASKILQTGTDIPDLRSLVVATAGASNIAALQRLGRGMRVLRDSDGKVIKNSVEVYDIYDVDEKAVNPHTGRKRATKMKWFEKHAEERLAWYRCEGNPVTIK
jgi:superfamily II DNA or RNA helicase